MKTLDVSVVIPFFNSSETLDRLLQSIAWQTLKPCEVVFVDDASEKEELVKLTTKFQCWQDLTGIQVVLLELGENQGVSAARNSGWDACKGDLVAFLDADDAWHPNKIQLVEEAFRWHPELAVIGHLSEGVENWPTTSPVLLKVAKLKKVGKARFLIGNPFVTCSTVTVRANIDIRFDPTRQRAEDYALWLKLVSTGLEMRLMETTLSYFFKAPYGDSGLSEDVWAMEVAEISALRGLYLDGEISFSTYCLVVLFSYFKFIRRLLRVSFR